MLVNQWKPTKCTTQKAGKDKRTETSYQSVASPVAVMMWGPLVVTAKPIAAMTWSLTALNNSTYTPLDNPFPFRWAELMGRPTALILPIARTGARWNTELEAIKIAKSAFGPRPGNRHRNISFNSMRREITRYYLPRARFSPTTPFHC